MKTRSSALAPAAVGNVLRPVRAFLPDWPARRVNDWCRDGKVPGAKKLGATWMMTAAAFARWVGEAAPANDGAEPVMPTVESAEEHLRRLGVIG